MTVSIGVVIGGARATPGAPAELIDLADRKDPSARTYVNALRDRYPHREWMAVVYDPVSGWTQHTVRGGANKISLFRQPVQFGANKRNIVVTHMPEVSSAEAARLAGKHTGTGSAISRLACNKTRCTFESKTFEKYGYKRVCAAKYGYNPAGLQTCGTTYTANTGKYDMRLLLAGHPLATFTAVGRVLAKPDFHSSSAQAVFLKGKELWIVQAP